jgi:hypothetical protein
VALMVEVAEGLAIFVAFFFIGFLLLQVPR